MILGRAVKKLDISRNRPARRGPEFAPANENQRESAHSSAISSTRSLPFRARVKALLFGPAGSLGVLAEEERSHRRPFLFAPVAVGGGAALWFKADSAPDSVSMLTILCLCGLLAAWLRHRRPALASCLVCLLLTAAGALLAMAETWRTDTILLDRPLTVTISGRILEREASGDGQWRYRLQVMSARSPVLRKPPLEVSVTARQAHPYNAGEIIVGRARLSPPSGPAAPGAMDFSFAAYFSGLGATGFYYGPPRLVQGPPHQRLSWRASVLEMVARGRASIGEHIRQTVGGDEGALAAALITNEQRAISRETVETLRKSGLAHIIAISGMNMVLAAAVFFVGIRFLFSLSLGLSQALPVKKLAALCAAVGTGAYYLLSGFAVSAERAFLMMAITLAAVLADRPAISQRNVALTAWAILFHSPSAGLSASFQLSFSGTIGLIAAYEAWAQVKRKTPRLPRHAVLRALGAFQRLITGLAATALVGGLSTALFSMAHFQRFPVQGFLANMLAAPILDFIVMPMALAAMLLMPLGLDGLPLTLMGHGLGWIIGIGAAVASSGGELTLSPLPPLAFLLGAAGFLLLCLLRTRLRLAGLVLLVCALGITGITPGKTAPDLLLHEGGELGAFLADGKIWLAQQSASAFVTEQWQRLYGMEEIVLPVTVAPDPDGRRDQSRDRYRPLTDEEEIIERILMAETLDGLSGPRFACKKYAWCLGKRSNRIVAILTNGIYKGLACDLADIVVARTSPGFMACRSGAVLISTQALRLTGSQAIRLAQTKPVAEIEPSYSSLDRPWLANRTYDWRTAKADHSIPDEVLQLLAPKPEVTRSGHAMDVLPSGIDE